MKKVGGALAGASAVAMAFAWPVGGARAEAPEETARAFGAREGVEQLSLSPDGSKIAFIASSPSGQGSKLYTVSTAEGATPAVALSVNGDPDRLSRCHWVSETRLVCTVFGVVKAPGYTLPLQYTRVYALDADGRNQQLLTNMQGDAAGPVYFGGTVIDWLPGQGGKILMSRQYQKALKSDSNIASTHDGLGVDLIDTRGGSHKTVEVPRPDAQAYITDGHGNVRVLGYRRWLGGTGEISAIAAYQFRKPGEREWHDLSQFNVLTTDGFLPYAVDPDRNVAFGFRKLDGRLAVYTKALDESGREALVLARPDVDVNGLEQIGRNQRVVGASFATDLRQIVYFDPAIKSISDALHRTLPGSPLIYIIDASADESKLLIFAGSDTDPGRYYLFDRSSKHLQILMLERPQLEGRALSTQKAISYKAADGTVIPAYLTLPPGKSDGRGLPAIVMPHGSSIRDEWGFDWLPQYFAARGYAVIQPEYRGSYGYGDAFFQKNGFRSWRVAIGDVTDAGKWLVAQGIADPAKLAIVGWGYGGYAALQSAVVEPGLFKAVVAVAPITDLARLKEDLRHSTGYQLTVDYVGSDAAIVRDGSPAQNADRIKVPVLLAHGTLDHDVGYGQSTEMEARLRATGGKVELMKFPDLDHELDDSSARAKLLERSDAFIRAAIGG